MQLFAGTSGFSFREWKGTFYPADLADDRWLAYYAQHLPAVEINNTFYRMPRSAVMERWAGDVPDGFRFVIKASQRITHRARLADCEEPVDYLWRAVSHLGEHLGPVLFQLPPYFKKDAGRLVDFLAALPEGLRAVMEFRHASWFDDEVLGVLEGAGAARCAADADDEQTPPLVATADFGYLRLRRSAYASADLEAWTERLRATPWREAWVFLKHEQAGPQLARELLERFASV